jgi:hypothetical protein
MRGLGLRALRLIALAAIVTVLLAACGAASPPSVPLTPGTSAAPAPAASVGSAPATSAPPPSAEIVLPTPLAAWPLDGDGAGSPGEPLTFVGTHQFDHGAVVLDGVTGYGTTAGPGPLDTTASFTVAAWVTVGEKSPFGNVLSQVGETAAAFYLGLGEGDWAFSMKDLDTNDPGHTVRAQGSPAAIDPAAWVHVAGVFDEPAGQIRLYVDGKRTAETSFDAPWQAPGAMMVGGSKARGGPSDFWPGAIDAATVYQSALTDDEIERLRDASRPTASAPVLAAAQDASALEVFRGTWDYPVTDADPKQLRQIAADGAAEAGKPEAKVALRFGFDGDRWWQGLVLDGELWLLHGVPEGDNGVMAVDGDALTMTNGRDGWMTYHWDIARKRLTLALLECVSQDRSGECPDKDIVSLINSHAFTRSGTDPTY